MLYCVHCQYYLATMASSLHLVAAVTVISESDCYVGLDRADSGLAEYVFSLLE